jgi:effector-binding domain-containing protein
MMAAIGVCLIRCAASHPGAGGFETRPYARIEVNVAHLVDRGALAPPLRAHGGKAQMITAPNLEDRPEQPYAAIRTQATMQELPTVIPQLLGEVFAWLGRQGVAPAGAPFIRYLVIDMAAKLDIELGVPVATAVSGDGRVAAGVLPAGRYATLVYTGLQDDIAANAALLNWGAEQGLVWDKWVAENGDGFGARLESYLTDPDDEPDPEKWETEVAIRLADDQPR